jgi:hypothetical protein
MITVYIAIGAIEAVVRLRSIATEKGRPTDVRFPPDRSNEKRGRRDPLRTGDKLCRASIKR